MPVPLAQQLQRLARQANMVIILVRVDAPLAALHALPGKEPIALFEVDLGPGCLDQLAGLDEHQQHQAHRDPRRHTYAGLVRVQRPQESRKAVGTDRCKVPFSRGASTSRKNSAGLRSASPQRTAYLNTREQLAVSRFAIKRLSATKTSLDSMRNKKPAASMRTPGSLISLSTQ
jgi:hypothetical protein